MVAAKRVFSVKGFSKATMEDIAKEAELSPGTLYLYFKNKDELYASLSLRILQYLLIRLEHLNAEPDLSPDEMIESLKETMYDVYEFDPLILVNMFHLQSSEALKNLTPELLSEIKELSQNSLNAMAKIFEKGIGQGNFVEKKPLIVSDIVWAMFSGIVLWEESKKIFNQESNSLKETLEIAFDIFAQGIKNLERR